MHHTTPVIFFPFIGDTVGGSHLSALALIKDLQKRQKFTPVIGIHNVDGPLAAQIKKNAQNFIKIPEVDIVTTGTLITQIKTAFKAAKPLARFLKEHNISIVHVNDIRCLYTWILATKIARKKIVWHQRTSSNSIRVAALSLFIDAIITISDYTKRQMRYPARKKAKVIHNPITLTRSTEDTPPHDYYKELKLLKETFIVGSVGNLTPQKRPDFILEIAKKMRTHDKKIVFVIIGAVRDDYGKRIAQQIQEEGLEKHVFLLGAQFPIDAYMKGFDCLLAPATNEGLGRTLIEAFLCRIPVIASAHGGHIEIIRNNQTGFLVPPDDIDAHITQLEALWDKKVSDLSQLLDLAEQYAKENFSTEEHVDHVEMLYTKLDRKIT